MARAPEILDRHEWLSFEDPEEDRTWLFDLTFLLSRWTCIFGRGCQGVLTEPSPELVQGCCSYGAHFTDDDDRARTEEIALTLTDDEWQFAKAGRKKGVTQKQDGEWTSRLHKDACIFLNRPGFASGAGCAFHIAAVNRGLPHMALKPEVCWQLPLRRLDSSDELGHVTSTLREWKRRDWSEGGFEFAWWCTDSPDSFIGEQTVLSSMGEEIVAMVGQTAYDLLLAALAERSVAPLPHPAAPVRVASPRRRRASA
jgi:hypothetical protein